MKILIISPKNKTVFNFRGDLIKSMVSAGHTVYVTGPNRDFVDDIMALGVSGFIEIPLVKDNTNVAGDLKYCKLLKKAIKEQKPDLVFSYTIKPVTYGSIMARAAGVKKIFPMVTGLGRVYTSDSLKAKSIRLLTGVLYKKAFKGCEKVIFQNNDDMARFVSLGYLPEAKAARVNGSGVNMQRFTFAPLPETPVFLMVGRIIKEKGVMEFCRAARAVRAKYPQTRFILLGGYDNSLGALCEDDIRSYIDDGSIEFPGEVKDPVEFYQKASVFVLPSYYREGLPRTILEAMSCGRAIITTDWPGCRDTVDEGVNGYLVKPKDAEELSERMERLVADRNLLERMSQNSLRICRERYEIGLVNKAMRDIIGY